MLLPSRSSFPSRALVPAAVAWFVVGLAPPAAFALTIGPDRPLAATLAADYEPDIAAVGDRAIAVWLPYYGVSWAYSLDGGSHWVAGPRLPYASSQQSSVAHPSVCMDDAGHVGLAVVVNVPSGYPLAVFRGQFSAGGVTWLPPVYALPAGANYDAPRIACDPARGHLYLSYTLVTPGSLPESQQQTIFFLRSLDGGATWSAPLNLSGVATCNGSQPAVGPDGELYVVWEDYAARQMVGRKSADFGASFGAQFVVGAVNDNLATLPPRWIPDPNRRNPIYPWGYFAPDFPSLAVDRSSGPLRGTLYATWTDYLDGAWNPPPSYVVDTEPNDSFDQANPVQIGQDIYGFVEGSDFPPHIGGVDWYVIEGKAGTTVWIAGQITDQYPYTSSPVVELLGFRCGPAGPPVLVGSVRFSDYRYAVAAGIFTFPSNGRYYLVISGVGPYLLNYWMGVRTWEGAAGSVARDQRDVVLVRSSDGGASWSPKVRVNDDPPRFDNAFPRAVVDGEGRVHVAWYDRRDDPECEQAAETYWTFSDDGGRSFRPSQRLSRLPSLWSGSPVGDHLGLAASADKIYAVWTQVTGGADIYGTVIFDLPTSIAVPRFLAEPGAEGVRLRWTVADAREISGFRVERAAARSAGFSPLDALPIPVRGTGEYEAWDGAAEPGARYRYRLAVVHRDGAVSYEGPVEVELPGRVTHLAWVAAGPNPFAGSLRLALASPRAGEVRVSVYDLRGEEVAELHRGGLGAGRSEFTWEGRDRSGRAVPPGVYAVRATLGAEVATHRVMRIR
jgi:hypothetical protein